ncbi:kinase-like domain-containing protein [Aspergillus foveolatus]|uniref:kinase-like domain-containing protein n=1 Tax=Aspergillus foveolatus TaxID=210207 RepID=UPI003CCE484F
MTQMSSIPSTSGMPSRKGTKRWESLGLGPTRQLGSAVISMEAYKHLATVQYSNIGRRFIRPLLGSFELERPDGTHHHCLVHQPLQITLYDLQKTGGALRHVFQVLGFLRTDANITHCDLKASNIMLTIEAESILEDFEKAEEEDPSPRRLVNDERSIYATRHYRQVRIGSRHPHEWIQPEIYRVPEIILELDWSHSVDIWNAGCLVWDMLAHKHLFNGQDEKGYTNRYHIAEMAAYLGTLPVEFQQRSSRSPLVLQ